MTKKAPAPPVAAFLILVVFAIAGAVWGGPQSGRKSRNVILVTLDGMRWQEVFRGADLKLIDKEGGGVKDVNATKTAFWREDRGEARRALMPFLWSVIGKQGQIFGDPDEGARAVVTNGKKFSYPGYQELLCGFPDAGVDSNAKKPNPNISVLEWMNAREPLKGSVAAFSGWDVHPFILNKSRSGIYIKSHRELPDVARTPELLQSLRDFHAHTPAYWHDFTPDALTFQTAKEYLLTKKPGALYLALGETDEWAHARRYDLYLEMARAADAMIQSLWETASAMESHRGSTTLIVTVDHGRGRTAKDWTDHGEKTDGAEEVWMAILGPDTPALGVRKQIAATQAQVAATVAAALGLDYNKSVPKAAPPLPGVFQ